MSKFGEGLGQISMKGWSTVPLSQLATPPKSGLYSVKVNEWFAVDEKGDALMYKGKTPQCNPDKRVVEAVYGNGKCPMCHGVVQVPLAMFPIDIKDYA